MAKCIFFNKTKIAAGLVACLNGTMAFAVTGNGGVMMRLSLHPDVSSTGGAEDETETTTDEDGVTTDKTTSTSTANSAQSSINIGAGYTLPFGLHLGASLWQETTSFTIKSKSSDPDSTTSGSEYSIKSKATTTAAGPTIGFVHQNGFRLFFTPFATVATSSSESSEFTYNGSNTDTDNDPEPVVTNRSKSSGYRLDLAYHFRFGAFSIGPELSYTSMTTKVDVTTEESRTKFNDEVETTLTRETGKTSSSRLLPMVGMAFTL